MFAKIVEMYEVANKLDDMITFNEDGEPRIVTETETLVIDETNKPLMDFVLGVHTLVELIIEQ